MWQEIVGITASVFIVLSLVFKTTTFKGTLLLRLLNSVGCIFFIVYGAVLPAISTAIANSACLVINIVFIIVETRSYLKKKKLTEVTDER